MQSHAETGDQFRIPYTEESRIDDPHHNSHGAGPARGAKSIFLGRRDTGASNDLNKQPTWHAINGD